MHKFRASALAEIMTDPKGDELLSVGGKTCVEKIAKQLIYGYEEQISSKYMEKGILVEDRSIELYNAVFFTDYKKNTERKTNDWITGECDIFTGKKIIDMKSSWSIPTFPATVAAGRDKGYEWQGRAYMMLWDVDLFDIAYALVDTPVELIGYEPEELHNVEHINPELRLTIVPYERDRRLEDKIKTRVEAANKYLDQMVKQIAEEHNF
jgi:hypothetical protein